MATDTTNLVFEEVLQNVRKAAETNLKMQQEFFQRWASLWPGLPKPKSDLVNQTQEFQKQWADTVSELAHKHREVVDKQFAAAVDSLDQALKLTEYTDPKEFREKSEEFYRKMLECLREVSEAQVGEFQEAFSKWSKLANATAAGGDSSEK